MQAEKVECSNCERPITHASEGYMELWHEPMEAGYGVAVCALVCHPKNALSAMKKSMADTRIIASVTWATLSLKSPTQNTERGFFT